jgi:hypothetical protein
MTQEIKNMPSIPDIEHKMPEKLALLLEAFFKHFDEVLEMDKQLKSFLISHTDINPVVYKTIKRLRYRGNQLLMIVMEKFKPNLSILLNNRFILNGAQDLYKTAIIMVDDVDSQ